ncbi:hypothetical protein GYA19_06235, partial [Candidatus Beckwithbacteria bacterium]|nr:hypothetical protein [Candidatus Beckwithbacteria bacterium]
MQLVFDQSLLFEENIGKNGLKKRTVNKEELDAFQRVSTKLIEHEYEFINILKKKEILDSAKIVFEKIKWAKNLVVLGIGGSDLGGRMLKQALEADQAPMNVIFAGETTDPEEYRQLFKQLNPEETVVDVISKSGSTTETA